MRQLVVLLPQVLPHLMVRHPYQKVRHLVPRMAPETPVSLLRTVDLQEESPLLRRHQMGWSQPLRLFPKTTRQGWLQGKQKHPLVRPQARLRTPPESLQEKVKSLVVMGIAMMLKSKIQIFVHGIAPTRLLLVVTGVVMASVMPWKSTKATVPRTAPSRIDGLSHLARACSLVG